MTSLRSGIFVVAAALLALGTLFALAAAAQSVTVVAVVDDEFVGPDGSSTTTVTEGQTVRWRWASGNDNPHTVSALDGSFDSDDACAEGETGPCRDGGTVFEVRFDEPGTYRYRCKIHGTLGFIGMTGTVVVEPAPADDGPPPPGDPSGDDPEPSPSPSPTPTSSPSPTPSPSPTGGDTSGGGESGSTGPAPRRAPGQTAPQFRSQIDEEDGGDGAPDPDVAPPDREFSPFPSPPPSPQAEAEADEDLAVVIPDPGGDGPSRTLLVGIATGLLVLTGGGVLKVLLATRPA